MPFHLYVVRTGQAGQFLLNYRDSSCNEAYIPFPALLFFPQKHRPDTSAAYFYSDIGRFLEPAAGIGSFIASFSENQNASVTAYEKDLLTGKILKQLYPESTIRISGFEEIPEKEQNSYDVIASNIPFGDTSVFDLSYSRSKDTAKVQAARSIHNCFFLKGADMLREGGLLAYITSQGILNSSRNEPIRRALMQDNNLVSAVRLPNNLFTEYAGTEVGSDLLILQKKHGETKPDRSCPKAISAITVYFTIRCYPDLLINNCYLLLSNSYLYKKTG